MPIRKQKCERCKFIKSNGQKCKRNTCKGFLCWQHSMIDLGIRVKKSTIPNAGFGLFATKDMKKDHKIGEYNGIKMTKKEVDTKYKGTAEYVICDKNRCIDGSHPNSSFVRYMNRAPKKPNAKFKNMNNNHQISVKTTKHVPRGSELFVKYGRAFQIS